MHPPEPAPPNWWHLIVGLIVLFFLWAIAFLVVFIEEMAMALLVKPSRFVFERVGNGVVRVRRWM